MSDMYDLYPPTKNVVAEKAMVPQRHVSKVTKQHERIRESLSTGVYHYGPIVENRPFDKLTL
jgi:hypothetical protein